MDNSKGCRVTTPIGMELICVETTIKGFGQNFILTKEDSWWLKLFGLDPLRFRGDLNTKHVLYLFRTYLISKKNKVKKR
jgi:hypothetical protein